MFNLVELGYLLAAVSYQLVNASLDSETTIRLNRLKSKLNMLLNNVDDEAVA